MASYKNNFPKYIYPLFLIKNALKFRVKRILLDVFALNSFSYLIGFLAEFIIADMDYIEHLKVRLIAFIGNTLIAHPYSVFRNYVFSKTQLTSKDSFIKYYLLDTFVFLCIQTPVYVGHAIFSGASAIEIIKATIIITLFSGLLGKPYGSYLDWLNNVTGLNKLNGKLQYK